jgi:hypothetical protein
MTQADYKIREALIALMCVGDYIFYLATNQADINIRTNLQTEYHVITTHRILEISDNQIRVGTRYAGFLQNKNMIDEYQGRLYIWNMQNWFDPNHHELRIAKMAEYIESPNTKYIKLEV